MSGRSRGGSHVAERHGGDERWVISYADLVTLLLGFFIILYATSELDIERFESLSLGLAKAFNVPVKEGVDPAGTPVLEGGRGLLPGPINTGQIDRDLVNILQALDGRERARQIDPGQIEVRRDGESIVFRISDSLVFPSASAELREEALPLLQVIGEVVRDLPNEIRVEGHTDNVPVVTERYPSNWELSSARATAVLRYLTEEVGVDPSHVYAAGYGEHRPLATNETPEGRAQNRRADIVVLYDPQAPDLTEGDLGDFVPDLSPDLSPDVAPDLAPDLSPSAPQAEE